MTGFGKTWGWLQGHPKLVDASIAAALGLISALSSQTTSTEGLSAEHDALFFLLVLTMTAPLIWRRVRPDVVLALCLGAFLVFWACKYDDVWANNSPMIAMYSIGAYLPRHKSVPRTLGIIGAGVFASIFITTLIDPPDSSPFSIVSSVAVFGCAWLLGQNTRLRRADVAALEERAEQAERARDEEARQAAELERTRIAREMHDIVAHSMSVMVVQAGGARKLLASDREGATEALLAVEATGRQGLNEMRRLLGVLRSEEDEGGRLAPQPTLASLDDLVARSTSEEFAIELSVDGEVKPVSPGVDVSAYRIVQEALTNVHKHAGNAKVDVRVEYEPHWISLTIADDGRGAARDISSTGGHGLIGMRERVEVYGGQFSAGPQPGGGFAVKARLPIDGEGANEKT